jgi:hypothetical protein
VKTEEGKRVSRLNAVKHGFFSHLIIKQDKLAHHDFCQEIHDSFSPASAYEVQLIEIVLSNLLAYRRICVVESKLIGEQFDKKPDPILKQLGMDAPGLIAKFGQSFVDELLKIQRYKTASLNLMLKTQHELERRAKLRDGQFVPCPSVCDVTVSRD